MKTSTTKLVAEVYFFYLNWLKVVDLLSINYSYDLIQYKVERGFLNEHLWIKRF